MDVDSFHTLVPQQQHPLYSLFAAWKQRRLRAHKKISYNIKAISHYYASLFRKTTRSFALYKTLALKKLAFQRLCKATLWLPSRQSLTVQSIISVSRKRQAVRHWHCRLVRKKYCSQVVRLCSKKRNLILLQKYLRELKIETILQRVGRIHQVRTEQDSKYESFQFLRKWCAVRKLKTTKARIALQQYNRWLCIRFFGALNSAPVYLKLQALDKLRKKKHFKQFVTKFKSLVDRENNLVTLFNQARLRKRYFGYLFKLTVSRKTIQLHKQRLLSRCFDLWRRELEKTKAEIENIPEQLQCTISNKHKRRVKATIMQRFKEAYRTRIENRRKNDMVKEYRELKEVESLYRKCFNMLLLNVKHNIAQRHHEHNLRLKTLQGIKATVIKWRKLKERAAEFIKNRTKWVTERCFNVLTREFQTRFVKPRQHYNSRVLKKCIDRWIGNIVVWYLQNNHKGVQYYETNMKFKVLFGLKEEVRLTRLSMKVVSMRVKMNLRFLRLYSIWRRVAQEQRYRVLKVAMRQWKLLVALRR